jgi:Lon protease-like protein
MELPLFPLNTVLFPGATLPLLIFEERYKLMIGRCLERNEVFGVVLIRSGQEVGGPAEPFEVGTTARITRSFTQDDGRIQILTVGERRFRILRTYHHEPYLTGEVEFLADEDTDAPGLEETAARVRELFGEYSRLTLALNNEWTRQVGMPHRPAALANFVGGRLAVDMRTRQRLLEESSVPRRLALEERLLDNALVLLRARLEAARRLRFGSSSALN